MDAVEMERFYEENAVDGELPPEKTEELLQAALGGAVDTATTGDTESGDAPGPEEAKAEETPEQKEEQEADAPEPEPEQAEKPVIVARDGKNTIPYSELADAREAAQNERSQREALERELAAIKAKYEPGEDADGGDTPNAGAENDAAAKLREDWPEVAEAVDGIVGKQQERIKALEAQIAQLQPATEQMAAERAAAAHYGAITQAHPDAADIVNSKEFAAWQQAQPAFMQQIFGAVLERGTADQVIELFDGFKQANPAWGKSPNDAAASDNAAKQDPAARQEAVKQAKEKAAANSRTPRSLTDIPGGEAAPTDTAEAFMQKSPEAQLASMMSMSADKREELMRRLT